MFRKMLKFVCVFVIGLRRNVGEEYIVFFVRVNRLFVFGYGVFFVFSLYK